MQRIALAALAALLVPAAFPSGRFVVSPLANRSGDQGLDWVGEAVADAIRAGLSAEGVPVASRSEQIDAAKRLSLASHGPLSLAAVTKIGEKVEAQTAVYGYFRLADPPPGKTRGPLQIIARAVDIKAVRQTADTSVEGELESLPSLEADLAWNLLKASGVSPRAARSEFLAPYRRVKITALENYIRGLMATSAELRHRHFTQASLLDPGFSPPAYHLGRLHWDRENYAEAARWFAGVDSESPHYFEAIFLGGVSRYENADYAGARDLFARLSRAQPAPEVWNNLGAAMASLGDPQAAEYFTRALEARPTDPDYLFNAAYSHWRQSNFERAAAMFRSVLDRTPDDQDAMLLLGRSMKQSGPRPGDLRTEGLHRVKDEIEALAPASR